ncbi:hypothetical protein GN956_G19272 [Arapaima gigas]
MRIILCAVDGSRCLSQCCRAVPGERLPESAPLTGRGLQREGRSARCRGAGKGAGISSCYEDQAPWLKPDKNQRQKEKLLERGHRHRLQHASKAFPPGGLLFPGPGATATDRHAVRGPLTRWGSTPKLHLSRAAAFRYPFRQSGSPRTTPLVPPTPVACQGSPGEATALLEACGWCSVTLGAVGVK